MSDCKPWTWKQPQTLWHPDSPGERVKVARYLPWWRRSKFATLTDVIRLRRQQAAMRGDGR